MKKNVQFLILSMIILGIISGCQMDVPKSETMPKIGQMDHYGSFQEDIIPVFSQYTSDYPSLFVQYETKGNNVFVECILTGISFRESDKSKQKIGKMVVWIDGRKKQEVTSAAFIVKGLSPGNHKLKLEVVQLNNKSYGIMKEFLVNIPR
jgi:hypothetical protein